MRFSAHSLQTISHSPALRLYGAAGGGAVLLGLAVWGWVRSRRPSAAELERRRRDRLMQIGRLTSGTLTDARWLSGEESVAEAPEALLYEYELRGVTYQCGQDVSTLAERVRGWRLDLPVSVRYDPANPGNSVIVTEDWGGHWGMGRANGSHQGMKSPG